MSDENALKEITAVFTDSPYDGKFSQKAEELIEREKLASRVAWARNQGNSRQYENGALSDNQLRALQRFGAEARKLLLSYIVVKGLPLSQAIYGDYRVRASRDIDILVAKEDLPKAHTVALKAGFVQIAEGSRSSACRSGAMGEAMPEGAASDYPILSDRDASNLSPYFRAEEDGSTTVLELHYTYSGLPDSTIRPIVSLASTCDINGIQIPVPRPAFNFVTLLLAAHDACEGMRANLQEGPLGLKHLVDLHCWIRKGAPLSGVAKFVSGSGLLREVGRALYDLVRVFPDAYSSIGHLSPMYESPWGMSYEVRALDPKARRDNAISIVNRAIEAQAAAQGDVVVERLFGTFDYIEFPAKGQVRKEERRCIVEWLIDVGALELELPNLAFNVSLIWGSGSSSSSFGEAFSLSRDEDRWKLTELELRGCDLDDHILGRPGLDVSSTLEVSCRGRFVCLAFAYELPAYVSSDQICASVAFRRREFGGVYHIIQGEKPMTLLAQRISEEADSRDVCSADCARLAYDLMWRTLQSGACKQKSRFFAEDGSETAIAWFMFFGELNATWTNGTSVDPTIYEGFEDSFEEKMSQRNQSGNANAAEALAFVKEYLLEQAPLFDCTGEDPDDVLLNIFEKEITDEEWKAKYDELTKNLVVL